MCGVGRCRGEVVRVRITQGVEGGGDAGELPMRPALRTREQRRWQVRVGVAG